MNKPATAVIVGAGHRALVYASYAKTAPEKLAIVGVADPSPVRRKKAAGLFDLPASACFESAEELAQRPRLADCVINGTMDHLHVSTSVPLIEAGYHVLLEKPFALDELEVLKLANTAQAYKRKVMICHVLRYAPFYGAIRQEVANGAIGTILNIQTLEHVSYHHMAVGFIRGKWANSRTGSSMLLAKCCHDLDIIMWMKSGIRPSSVASFGGLMHFRKENAPPGSGTRCLGDCEIEEQCPYSARKHYLDHPDRWAFYVWSELEHLDEPSFVDRETLLSGDSPYGRCVWRSDNNVVDHQSVVIQFADGATATHNMVGGTARPSRAIHILGTSGEIQGVMEDNRFVIRHIDPRPGHEYSEDVHDLNSTGDMHGAFGGHGGGDLRLIEDFVKLMTGGTPSPSVTTLDDSVNGHLAVFCADRSMSEHRVVDLAEIDFRLGEDVR